MLRYNSATGETVLDGHFEGIGYSGFGEGKDNPAMEAVPNIGPIPRGHWKIGAPVTHPHLGPLAFPLTPVGHDAHKRTEFFIHGANALHPNDSSHGCPILGRSIRERIRDDKETELDVV